MCWFFKLIGKENFFPDEGNSFPTTTLFIFACAKQQNTEAHVWSMRTHKQRQTHISKHANTYIFIHFAHTRTYAYINASAEARKRYHTDIKRMARKGASAQNSAGSTITAFDYRFHPYTRVFGWAKGIDQRLILRHFEILPIVRVRSCSDVATSRSVPILQSESAQRDD